jgi:hypothetical protein
MQWRRLIEGEIIIKGDRFHDNSGSWVEACDIGRGQGHNDIQYYRFGHCNPLVEALHILLKEGLSYSPKWNQWEEVVLAKELLDKLAIKTRLSKAHKAELVEAIESLISLGISEKYPRWEDSLIVRHARKVIAKTKGEK